jgi:HEAT repeat protein
MLMAPAFISRFEAANTLRAIGPGAKDAVPALLKSLNDRHPYVRAMAAIALLKIAPENESQITPDVLSHAKDWIERVEKKGGRYGIGFVPAPQPKFAEAATAVSAYLRNSSKRASSVDLKTDQQLMISSAVVIDAVETVQDTSHRGQRSNVNSSIPTCLRSRNIARSSRAFLCSQEYRERFGVN